MVDETRNTSWRQGHVLTSAATHALNLLHPSAPNDTIVIVATHDCDVVQSCEAEPVVEVLVGRKIPAPDGNSTHGKSSRTLHIEVGGSSPFWLEVVATAKKNIGKAELFVFSPDSDAKLSPESCNTLQGWLAARYRRSAFPDEFETRLKEAKLVEKIKKAVEPSGTLITKVFFDVDEGEDCIRQGEADVYQLDIILLHVTEPDFYEAENAAQIAAASIKKAFEARLLDKATLTWRSIELRDVDVVSEEAMSYRVFRNLKPWKLDHLSFGAEPQQPVMSS